MGGLVGWLGLQPHIMLANQMGQNLGVGGRMELVAGMNQPLFEALKVNG